MDRTVSLRKITVIIFFFFTSATVAISLSQLNDISVIGKVTHICSVVVFFLAFFQGGHYTLQNIVFLMIGILWGILSYVKTGSSLIASLIMSIYIVRDVSLKQIVRYYSVTLLMAASMIVCSSLVGITNIGGQEVKKVTSDAFYMVTVHTFGFAHQNSGPIVFFAIIIGYIIFADLNHRLNRKKILSGVLFTGIVYGTFSSRTFLLSCVVFFGLLFVLPRLGKIKQFASWYSCLKYTFPMMTLLSLYVVFFYDSLDYNWYVINMALSTRPELWNYVMHFYSMNLLGNDFSDLPVALDNGYIAVLLNFGILALLFYNYIFVYISRKLFRFRYWSIISGLTAYSVYGLAETGILTINIYMIASIFGYLVFHKIGGEANA